MAIDETVRLRNVCVKIGSGATPRGGKEAYKGGATSLIRSQNIYNEGFHRDGLVYIDDHQSAELRNVEVKPNDVLLNITGDSVARCCQVAADVLPARVNQHVAIIRPEPKSLDARFLRYVLVSHEYQSRLLALASAGATRPALTKSMIEELDVPSPPLVEQKAIAAVLGALDDKIELNRRMNATLEAMARALFQSWFVDFDPVRAKLDGRLPAALDPATAALFPDSFHDSPLGLIPYGWEVKTIADVTFRVTKGDTPRSEAISACPQNDRLIPMLRVNAITEDGEVLLDKAEMIPESIHLGKSKRSILEENDILYTNAGTIGRVALVQKDFLPANTNQAMAIIRPDPARVPPAFLYMIMRQPEFQTLLHHDIVQAVQANLALGKISAAQAVFPPMETLTRLTAPLVALLNKVFENRTQSRTLATLRDTLLPKLLSGELSVTTASEQLEKMRPSERG